MDRALKERIVGATVLVVVAVLVVPVFLDGSPTGALNGSSIEAPMIEQRIDLPGQQPDDGVRTVVLDRDRSEPLPARQADEDRGAEEEPAAGESDSPPTATTEAPAAPVPVAAAPTPAASEREEAAEESSSAEAADEPEEPPPAEARPNRSATGMWAVQLGSFSNQANADRLAAELRQQGFAAFLSRLQTPNGELHRVRVGPQRDRDSAEAMAARLERAGQKGQVVPHP